MTSKFIPPSQARQQASAPQPPGISPDQLTNADDVKCDNCGNMTFEDVFLFKRISAIVSPTGKAGNVPIPTFACVSCGYVNAEFLPPFLRGTTQPASSPSPTSAPTPKIELI